MLGYFRCGLPQPESVWSKFVNPNEDCPSGQFVLNDKFQVIISSTATAEEWSTSLSCALPSLSKLNPKPKIFLVDPEAA